MKKNIKRSCLLVLSVVICLSLCSCTALDDMRGKQGKIMDNGNIFYLNKTYVPFVNPNPDLIPIANRNFKMIYLTKSDVPVLLSSTVYENEAYVNEDNMIITVEDNDGESHQYILFSKEQEYIEKIKNVKLDEFLFEYVYEEDADSLGNPYKTKCELVSNRVKTAINKALKEKIEVKETNLTEYDFFDITECDKNTEFYGVSYEVVVFQNVKNKDVYEFAIGNQEVDDKGNAIYYKIPKEYYSDFQKIKDRIDVFWNEYDGVNPREFQGGVYF